MLINASCVLCSQAVNSGDMAGHLDAVIDMLNRTCRPCRNLGLTPEEVFARFSRSYAAHLDGWIYSEQRELAKQLVARAPHGNAGDGAAAWSLDYGQDLFHVNDGYWVHHLRATRDGSVVNLRTGARAPLVHYNGRSKLLWRGKLSAASRARALGRAFRARRFENASSSIALSAEEAAMRSLLGQSAFVGPDLARQRGLGAHNLCTGPSPRARALQAAAAAVGATVVEGS